MPGKIHVSTSVVEAASHNVDNGASILGEEEALFFEKRPEPIKLKGIEEPVETYFLVGRNSKIPVLPKFHRASPAVLRASNLKEVLQVLASEDCSESDHF